MPVVWSVEAMLEDAEAREKNKVIIGARHASMTNVGLVLGGFLAHREIALGLFRQLIFFEG